MHAHGATALALLLLAGCATASTTAAVSSPRSTGLAAVLRSSPVSLRFQQAAAAHAADGIEVADGAGCCDAALTEKEKTAAGVLQCADALDADGAAGEASAETAAAAEASQHQQARQEPQEPRRLWSRSSSSNISGAADDGKEPSVGGSKAGSRPPSRGTSRRSTAACPQQPAATRRQSSHSVLTAAPALNVDSRSSKPAAAGDGSSNAAAGTGGRLKAWAGPSQQEWVHLQEQLQLCQEQLAAVSTVMQQLTESHEATVTALQVRAGWSSHACRWHR